MSDIRRIVISCAVVVLVLFSAFFVYQNMAASKDGEAVISFPPELEVITDGIDYVTSSLVNSTEDAADEISVRGTGDASSVLSDTYSETEYSVSFGFMNSGGILEAVCPDKYSESKGLDIGKTEPAKSILEMKKPVMTDAFWAQEGFWAVEMSSPVFAEDGEYLGAVMCMAEPFDFLSDIISPVENETGVSVTVMQTDGYILYDRDTVQVGKNLFSDPFFAPYTSLKNLGRIICSKKEGYGTYTFYDPESKSSSQVKKKAYWDTVKIIDKEWRVILFRPAVSRI